MDCYRCILFSFRWRILLLKHEDTFEFKTLSSSCSAFTISGNMAYNKNKSSISISNIVYCGGEDSNLYKQIDCVLYENDFDKNVKIGEQTITKQESISLEEFLKDVSFYIEDYERSCKVYHENSLFLEINAIDTHDHMITYKVPITIEGNC